MNRTELALKLLKPNEYGISDWVCKDKCVGEFFSLMPTNGNTWYRNRGISGTYNFEKKEEYGKIYWRLNGFKEIGGNRYIRKDIRVEILKKPCVITNIVCDKNEVDHRDGRYPIESTTSHQQKVEHFQPLHPTLNKQKRSDCLMCKKTGIRYDAKERGCTVSTVEGSLKYEGTCVGCFWYEPKSFLK
jgi:hypothetical protein